MNRYQNTVLFLLLTVAQSVFGQGRPLPQEAPFMQRHLVEIGEMFGQDSIKDPNLRTVIDRIYFWIVLDQSDSPQELCRKLQGLVATNTSLFEQMGRVVAMVSEHYLDGDFGERAHELYEYASSLNVNSVEQDSVPNRSERNPFEPVVPLLSWNEALVQWERSDGTKGYGFKFETEKGIFLFPFEVPTGSPYTFPPESEPMEKIALIPVQGGTFEGFKKVVHVPMEVDHFWAISVAPLRYPRAAKQMGYSAKVISDLAWEAYRGRPKR